MRQDSAPLLQALRQYCRQGKVRYHVPAHLGRPLPGWDEFAREDLFALDLTELPGLDDLHCPTGILKESETLAAEFFGSRRTFFLVNGVTGGVLASHLYFGGKGKKILLPRNAHKSHYHGLILAGSSPHYLPVVHEEGIAVNVTVKAVEEGLLSHPESAAVFITSPGYHGACADLRRISKLTQHQKVPLVVDEAHGTHLFLSTELPISASEVRADLWLQSTHKTGGSLTQGGMMHVGGEEIDISRLAFMLNMIQTTSPSYLIMASLDFARRSLYLTGRERVEMVIGMVRQMCHELSSCPGIAFLNFAEFQMDPLRLTLKTTPLGVRGDMLQELLGEVGVEAELADEHHLLFIFSLYHRQEEILFLKENLLKVQEKLLAKKEAAEKEKPFFAASFPFPQVVLSPREAMERKSCSLLLEKVKGRIAAEMVTPYPPGIPLLVPGEMITAETMEVLQYLQDTKKHCQVADPTFRTLQVLVE